MNGVIGMTHLLLDTPLTKDQQAYVATIQSSGAALLELINDILDFSKIEANQLHLEILDIHLAELVENVAASLALRAYEKGLELICAVAPDVPSKLLGDPSRLRQILVNLTSNAIKFTHEGEVLIQITLAEPLADDHAQLRIVVRDTGIGIAEDQRDRLFQKFTQVDASTTRQYGGTGLGLAISKQLVECMGGTIGVSSVLGQGSEFWIMLPLKRPAHDEPESLPAAVFDGVPTLIVDDNDTVSDFLDAHLAAWGMEPEIAADGTTALAACYRKLDQGTPFRVVLIDQTLPGMDGLTLARALRADDRLTQMHLVLLTAFGTTISPDALPSDTTPIAKPIRLTLLKPLLVQILSGQPFALASHPSPPPLAQLGNRQARLLLAEDNRTNQLVALGILAKFGLTADVANTGREAVAALQSQPYDLVLMDVQMPEMDGLEATRCIRSAQSVAWSNIPIVAMTAHAMQGDQDTCLAAGMNDYLTKPINPQRLAAILETWLPSTSAAPVVQLLLDDDAPPDAELHVLNRAAFLERLMGDEKIADSILHEFIVDLPDRIAALQEAIVAGDLATVTRLGHSLKGIAANVGAETLAALAEQIENAAHDGGPEQLATCRLALPAIVEELQAILVH